MFARISSPRVAIIIISSSFMILIASSNVMLRDQTVKDEDKIVVDSQQLSDSFNVTNRVSMSSLTLIQSKRRIVRCGHTRHGVRGRIVGGQRATISEYPWIVSIQREKTYWFGFKSYYHSCGGGLISPSWMVTAAHCLYNRAEPSRLVAGADNLERLYRAQLRSVSRMIIHEEFDINTYNNDIALIKVDQPYVLDSTFSRVSAICLDRDLPVLPYDIAEICGFGAQAFRERSRTHLYATDIAIIDERTCNESFEGAITENMICAGGMIAKKRDACSGDSGGPLMMDAGGYMSLIGVVSFGNDCALKNYPGIYTRVDNYIDWIENHIDEDLVRH